MAAELQKRWRGRLLVAADDPVNAVLRSACAGLLVSIAASPLGCANRVKRGERLSQQVPVLVERPDSFASTDGSSDSVQLIDYQVGADDAASDPPTDVSEVTEGAIRTDQDAMTSGAAQPISISRVVDSIHEHFPLLEAAYLEAQVANGKQVAAWGAFDTKLKGASENGPLGFYETYRNSAGVSKPIYSGGEFFGGYRVGRGSFEPWYLERQTNDGGEFKTGVSIPLAKNRQIDRRRADLWRATYDRQRVIPEIRMQLIQFVRDGSITYWQWVAAERRLAIGLRALDLAEQRNGQLQRKVEVGDLDPPVLQDNLRAIATRKAKVIDLDRKRQLSALKLALYYRDYSGTPIVAEESARIDFPSPGAAEFADLALDMSTALGQRPELVALEALANRIRVDCAEARNDMLPQLDGHVIGSQDVGEPSSSKRDKSEFELAAGITVEVPVQRRKGRGKLQAARAKLAQVMAKRGFTEDKIRVEVQSAYAARAAAYDRLEQARESVRLAEYMADVERRKFDLGESDLLSVVLREQQAIEAADSEVDSLLELYKAKADYDAAMARDRPNL